MTLLGGLFGAMTDQKSRQLKLHRVRQLQRHQRRQF
jgi:hypothetical protein